MVQNEMYGADDEINIIIQKQNEFKDVTTPADKFSVPRIYKSFFT